MRRFFLICAVVPLMCAVCRAENHRCTVDVQKVASHGRHEVSVDLNSRIAIGSFDVTVAKDASILKVYPLPGTKLFVIATVSYEDHILGSDEHPDFVNMRIFVSPQKRDDYLAAVAYAKTQVPFRAFGPDPYDSSTVTAALRLRGRSIMEIGMSCVRR